MERDSWTLDGMLMLVDIYASCLGCMWEPGGWSFYSCLLQTGMPRDKRLSWMCRKVNRYEDCTENQSQQMHTMGGGAGTVYCSYGVSADKKHCSVKEDMREEWTQRLERLGEKGPLSVLALE